MCGYIPWLSLLFDRSICLFVVVVVVFCQLHAVLITLVLQNSFKSGNMLLPALFFFLKIALEILCLFWFYINFRMIVLVF